MECCDCVYYDRCKRNIKVERTENEKVFRLRLSLQREEITMRLFLRGGGRISNCVDNKLKLN